MNKITSVALGVFGLAAIVGIIVLAALAHPIPDILTALAAGSLTGLAGITLPTPAGGAVSTASELAAAVAAELHRLFSTPAGQPLPAPAPATDQHPAVP